jgi:hypothetical protein
MLELKITGEDLDDIKREVAKLNAELANGNGAAPASAPPPSGTPPQVPAAHALEPEVLAAIDLAPGGAPRELFSAFMAEIAAWPGIKIVRRTPTHLWVTKVGVKEPIMHIRPTKPRVNYYLSDMPDWALGTPAKVRRIKDKNPRRVTVVLWSKASLDVARRLAKAVYDAA